MVNYINECIYCGAVITYYLIVAFEMLTCIFIAYSVNLFIPRLLAKTVLGNILTTPLSIDIKILGRTNLIDIYYPAASSLRDQRTSRLEDVLVFMSTNFNSEKSNLS